MSFYCEGKNLLIRDRGKTSRRSDEISQGRNRASSRKGSKREGKNNLRTAG